MVSIIVSKCSQLERGKSIRGRGDKEATETHQVFKRIEKMRLT